MNRPDFIAKLRAAGYTAAGVIGQREGRKVEYDPVFRRGEKSVTVSPTRVVVTLDCSIDHPSLLAEICL